jgi:hypothetical protein
MAKATGLGHATISEIKRSTGMRPAASLAESDSLTLVTCGAAPGVRQAASGANNVADARECRE